MNWAIASDVPRSQFSKTTATVMATIEPPHARHSLTLFNGDSAFFSVLPIASAQGQLVNPFAVAVCVGSHPYRTTAFDMGAALGFVRAICRMLPIEPSNSSEWIRLAAVITTNVRR